MEITPASLTSVNNGVSTAYNSQLFAAESVQKKFTYQAPSTGDEEVYPRLNMIDGLREWVGERVVDWLSFSTFAIKNKTYEKTIGVKRENLEDDKYGFLTPAAGSMGQAARELPDLLVAQLMNGGTSALMPDGANFFDTDHQNYDSNGNVVTQANYQAGSGPSWYLVCTKKILMPFIFQRRRPFDLKALFDPNSQEVFFKNEFLWGTDGRCNAGYGLWYLIYRSDAALNVANLETGRAAMAAWMRPGGTPMGIVPDLLVTGTTLFPAARAYCNNEFLPAGDPAISGSGTASNTFRGLAEAFENPWIA